MISSRICARFSRSVGLSSSQSGTQNLSDFFLDRSGRLGIQFFEWFAFRRVVEGSFSFYERIESAPIFRVLLSILFQTGQGLLQSTFSAAFLLKIALDGLVEQLIDRPAFDLAEVLQRRPLFFIDSECEGNTTHRLIVY